MAPELETIELNSEYENHLGRFQGRITDITFGVGRILKATDLQTMRIALDRMLQVVYHEPTHIYYTAGGYDLSDAETEQEQNQIIAAYHIEPGEMAAHA